jgi:MFS family permease
MGLKEELVKELTKNNSIYIVKSNLINRGYLEEDINKALKGVIEVKSSESDKNNTLMSFKEFFDRVGYGFASQQFINILFMLSGASLFLIGFVNGIKTALIYFLSGFLKEYSRIKYFGKSYISTAGIIYGLSFLGMAFAVVLHNPPLFVLSLLIGSVGVIAHGDLYSSFFNNILRVEHRKTFLKFISYFGIFITAISLLLAGLLMDWFPINGVSISFDPAWLSLLAPITFKIYGYLLTFEITAIMFILSGYLMSFIDEKKEEVYGSVFYASAFVKEYLKTAKEDSVIFIKNKKVLLLTLAAISMTIIQVVGNSYFGIFIYDNFKHQFLGGFMNVAIIFVIALITSISGTMLTKAFAKSLGEAPMLVFGTLLVALLPLTLYYNPNLYAIGLAVALSVIGGAVVGVAQGLIAERLMSEKEQSTYFSGLGFVSIIPTIILVTIGAMIAQIYSLQTLFLGLGIALAVVVMPIYFILVLIIDAEYKKEHALIKK